MATLVMRVAVSDCDPTRHDPHEVAQDILTDQDEGLVLVEAEWED